jgi:RNA polymerase sigma-70 factor (ECF subfamily)
VATSPVLAFISQLRQDGRGALADAVTDDAAVAEAIGAACAAGRAAWPAIHLPDEVFARQLARHAGAADDCRAYLDAVCAADLYLACACVAHDPAALRALESGELARLPAMLARMRPPREAVDEIRQRLRERFLVGSGAGPALADYSGRGPLGAWVRVAAVRTYLSQLRHEDAQRADGDGQLLELPAGGLDPDLEIVRARYADAFKLALGDALRALPRRERTLLRFAYVDAMTVDEIAAFYRTHRATAARWVARARTAVLEETRRLLAERVSCAETELHSLLRVVVSQLDLSIKRLLR